ncbi:hypothetical protein PN471_03865 [Aphanizomenon sp. CS-733/32]|uniref:hypothetical protein n=1 Tax=Aphanizomenon sp. CS-733/32 TaxID=3021715 RepID=UPI00232C511F|nr:hypothetical protein [Aphanizomenon sp. CS-733/32]MDB9307795.1 hypothetical protein [Aphanizomenon sp. CS-733/32]
MNKKILFFHQTINLIRFVSYLIIVSCIFLFVIFGLLKWPGLHHDSSLYATPILNLAVGNGWLFDAYTPALVARDSNEYSFHGVLYPIIFGLLLKSTTYEKLFFWIAITNALTFTVYTFLFYRTIETKNSAWGVLIATIFGITSGAICLYLQGRPEHLAPLLTSLPMLAREYSITRKYSRYFTYITLGLLFILSPLVGIIYGMGILFWVSLHYKQKLLRELLLVGLISTGTIISIIQVFCSFSTLDWIHNVFLVGNGSIIPIDWWRLTSNGFSLSTPAWNFLVIAIVFLVFRTLWQRKLFIVFTIWFILGYYLLQKVQVYGYVGLFPLLLLMTVGKNQEWIINISKIQKKLISSASIMFSVLYSAVFIRLILLFILYWQHGVSFEKTASNLREMISKSNQNGDSIAFDWMNNPCFIVFGKAGDSFVTAESSIIGQDSDSLLTNYERKFSKKIIYIVLPQKGHLSTPPQTLNQGMFILVSDGWSKKRASFMGVKLGGAMPGYQFALYKRTVN